VAACSNQEAACPDLKTTGPAGPAPRAHQTSKCLQQLAAGPAWSSVNAQGLRGSTSPPPLDCGPGRKPQRTGSHQQHQPTHSGISNWGSARGRSTPHVRTSAHRQVAGPFQMAHTTSSQRKWNNFSAEPPGHHADQAHQHHQPEGDRVTATAASHACRSEKARSADSQGPAPHGPRPLAGPGGSGFVCARRSRGAPAEICPAARAGRLAGQQVGAQPARGR